ncbi:hypothetical protein GYMLUDRAFT_60376 [Collybiopsis luxurians FD-317 M1]|uniref:F-box domain-containing protein n=1 Tax=Collybiopsis luxurians FD-317 M1 TaxID=944289 RepID=A0A0D0B6U3_9AGAR|nr:hypothetical protein GYMLUDRAFT_60376 [Collybiopsis luxurians FD-317 M1]
MVHLLDLPSEILCSLPLYFHNIQDLTEASSTCRTLYDAFSITSPNCILGLVAASTLTFAQPHPHFIIAATARQVSDWALGNRENTQRLRSAFQGGVDGLLALCIGKAGLTKDDIRRLYLARSSTIKPLADKIHKLVGQKWYKSAMEQWRFRTREATHRAAYEILIYGELFASTMQAYLEPEKKLPKFDLDVRLDYIKYCIPDWTCRSYPGFEVLKVGPYADGYEELKDSDQNMLHELLTSRQWNSFWQNVSQDIGWHFEEDRKQKLWFTAIQIQGIEGMKALAEGGVEECRELLLRIRYQVENLTDEYNPAARAIGTQLQASVFYAPDFANEVSIACGLRNRA